MTSQEPQTGSSAETDLETVDAAEAPEIAEALADDLEAELEDVGRTSGGDD